MQRLVSGTGCVPPPWKRAACSTGVRCTCLDWSHWATVVRDDMLDDVAYEITSVMVEERAELEGRFRHIPAQHSPLSYPIEPREMARGVDLPLHPVRNATTASMGWSDRMTSVRRQLPRRRALRQLGGLAACHGAAIAAGRTAWAQAAYPSKTVFIVVPFGGGNAYDQMVRYLADRLQSATGQPFVVDAKQGALGGIAASTVARAAPDGYTILFGANSTHAANVHLFKKLAYDPVADFRARDHSGHDPAGAGGVAEPEREEPAGVHRAGAQPTRQAELRQLQRHWPRGE